MKSGARWAAETVVSADVSGAGTSMNVWAGLYAALDGRRASLKSFARVASGHGRGLSGRARSTQGCHITSVSALGVSMKREPRFLLWICRKCGLDLPSDSADRSFALNWVLHGTHFGVGRGDGAAGAGTEHRAERRYVAVDRDPGRSGLRFDDGARQAQAVTTAACKCGPVAGQHCLPRHRRRGESTLAATHYRQPGTSGKLRA